MPNLFLIVPFPPSVNNYWGFSGHRRYLTKKAVAFKAEVLYQVSNTTARFGSSPVEISVMLYPPDRRARDIDNVAKSLNDALVQAGVMDDDSQIKKLTLEFGDVFKGGKAEVSIFPYLKK